MGWRSRFDPSKFGIDRDGGWRAAGARVRQAGLRGEVVVPLVAVLLLAVALGLSALSSRSPGEAIASPSAAASASALAVLPSGASAGAYPSPNDTAEPSGEIVPAPDITTEPPLDETSVAEASPLGELPEAGESSPDAYPEPSDAPVGEGEPVDELPPTPDLAPTPEDVAPIEQDPFPTPDYLDPIPTYDPGPPIEEDPFPTFDPGSPVDEEPIDDTYPPPDEEPIDEEPIDEEPIEEPTTDPFATPLPEGEEPVFEETPVSEFEATPTPVFEETLTPTATSVPPTPTARPADVIAGDTRWTVAQSPVRIERDAVVPAGSTLTVDPGVEVQLAPDVRLTVGGTLRAAGARFTNSTGRWQGLVGDPGSNISLDGVELRQAGSGGIAISSTEGTLLVSNSRIADNGGGIYAARSRVELRNNGFVGNGINGPAVNIVLPSSAQTVVSGNTFAGNGTPAGSQQLLITASDAGGPVTIEGNLFNVVGGAIGATINTGVPLGGSIRCNSFSGGTIGLQIQTNLRDASGFEWVLDSNVFGGQATFGATGSVGFNLSNNWWQDPSGPADPARNPQGRGVTVGLNQQFQPWLTERPVCAPN